MKFSDFKYSRPDLDTIGREIQKDLMDFNNAESAETQCRVIENINVVRKNFSTMFNIASVNYSIDTNNGFYEEEKKFFDDNSPIFSGYISEYYKALVQSKFKPELEKKFGKLLFAVADCYIKSYDPIINDDLVRENELCTEYNKLIATAKIFYDGEERNIAGMEPFMLSTDRAKRKEANEAKWKYYADNAEQLDRIFDDLVKVRHKIATKLGFKNFVELGYYRMSRTDYNAEDVKKFRSYVKKYAVPIAAKLKQRQANRLGLETLEYFDGALDFNSGNATPKGSPEWILENAKKMYEELSNETGEFFNFMVDNELMDLVNKKGKEAGGYCTFIEDYKAPFIFSNFNGTSHDIVVLTHEAGHAFQAYCSRNFDIVEYHNPTMEACEIHSMSMELLTWPWMHSFFKEDTEKFKFSAINGCMIFIPYGTAVDEFQHYVYENPDATPEERKACWRHTEKKYLPLLDYIDNDYLENGGRWQAQRHIYESPFYYIDYCLAQISAFEFWRKFNENRDTAMVDYIKLCKEGGSRSYTELLKVPKLGSPFVEECFEQNVSYVEKWLDKVDDMAL